MKMTKEPSPEFLSIPDICKIKQIIRTKWSKWSGYKVINLIFYDEGSGRKDRFNVISLNRKTGVVAVIGRELPLAHAKKICHCSKKPL